MGKTSPSKVLLMVSGCVQAEVTPRLAYNLLHHSKLPPLELIVVATESSLQFFNRKLVEKVTKGKVFVRHQDSSKKFPVPHIGLPAWADLIMVYPASANTLAKCAHGFSDTLLSNIVLAASSPVWFGPTMNDAMYANPLLQANIRTLKKVGHRFFPREAENIHIRSTNKVERKLYVSERIVLKTCMKLLGRKKRA